jgi:hypothetical protein
VRQGLLSGTERTYAVAAIADAETARICDTRFTALQPFSPKRSFALPNRAPGQTVRTPHDSRRMDVPFLPAKSLILDTHKHLHREQIGTFSLKAAGYRSDL